MRDGLDLGADIRADQSEKKCFGLVADVKVGRLARVQETLVEKAFTRVMSTDNIAFLRLLDNFARNYNNKLSEWLIGCLNNLIFFLGFEGFTHFNKGADLIPGHVLEKDIVFERDHDTAFGLLGLGCVLMSALRLFMVKEDSSPSLDFLLLFGGMFQGCRVFRLIMN